MAVRVTSVRTLTAWPGKALCLRTQSARNQFARPHAEDRNKAAFSEWNGILQWMHKRHDIFAPVSDAVIRTARTPKWKLNCNPGDKHELYDLENDPGEMQNLYGTPGTEEITENLLSRIRKWQKHTGDTIALGVKQTQQ
jgi:hypothetical protein